MRLYLECSMGASGDMLMSALYDLLRNRDIFRAKMDRLNLPDVSIIYSASNVSGFAGTHISVKIINTEENSADHREHNDDSAPVSRFTFIELCDLIGNLGLPDNILEDALGVFKLIGEAEAEVYRVPLDSLCLHESGSLDTVTYIVGCCMLINMLGVTDILVSPVRIGSGSLIREQGVLPIPSPAAAHLLTGIPVFAGELEGEFCTPAGAALLKYFAGSFGDLPPTSISRIGYGIGRNSPGARYLRVFLCEDNPFGDGERDSIFEISCNLDDMTPEAIGAASAVLLNNGALDVWSAPVYMKESRPAVSLNCLCEPNDRVKLSRLMLEHTTTLYVRFKSCRRDLLSCSVYTVTTEYGDIRVKTASGFGLYKRKPEFDDVTEAALRHGVPYITVYEAALLAAGKRP